MVIIDKLNNYMNKKLFIYMAGLFGINIVILAMSLAFPQLLNRWLFGAHLFFTLLLIMGYAVFIHSLTQDDVNRSRCKALVSGCIIETVLFCVLAPLLKLQNAIDSKALLSVTIMFTIIALVITIIFLLSDTGKKFMEMLETGVLPIMFGKKTINKGDIILCNIRDEVNAKAEDPREILPFKDRFLHMLVLGPTGCGKTSQILLPMVNQDMQNPDCGITVLEPKGDFAIKAAMMAQHYGREFVYFDPSYKNCPKFNPLAGREIDVVENIATTFRMLNPDSPQFFLDLNEQLVRNAVKVLKRLDRDAGIEGKFANLINLSRLLQNSGGQGREMVNEFAKISSPTEAEAKENADIATWFLNDYFPERSKNYENTSGVRSQVAKLVGNEYLREVLNPDVNNGESNAINFDKHLAEGGIICISTAQGALRDLSKYLGYFIILSLQSSVFRRPGNENTRKPHFLYIDEFQTYSTPGFADMLTQGRSYRVGSILATQARAQMAMGGGRDGKNFVELVSANARNVILFPGINKDDAKYYSEQFGEYEKEETMVGYSRKRFNPLTGGLDRLGHPTESIRTMKKMTPNFSSTDLIFGQKVGESFGEMVYSIIKNNSVQPARVGLITYIDKSLNDKLDAKIEQYNSEYARESAADFYAKEEPAAAEDELVFNSVVDNDEVELADLGEGQDTSIPEFEDNKDSDSDMNLVAGNSVNNREPEEETVGTSKADEDDMVFAFADEDIHQELTHAQDIYDDLNQQDDTDDDYLHDIDDFF